jgi:hypothetical protein
MSLSDSELKRIFDAAHAAGIEAANACTPTPMVVAQHENPLDDSSPVEKRWLVPQGVCGFAWITLKPGTSRAARYAKAHLGARKAYHGGVSIWVHQFNQSYELKTAYASAFVQVLRDAGIDAYADGRLD